MRRVETQLPKIGRNGDSGNRNMRRQQQLKWIGDFVEALEAGGCRFVWQLKYAIAVVSNASVRLSSVRLLVFRISMPLDDPDFLLAQEKFRFGRGELKWQKAKNYLDHFLLLFISSLQSCAACYLTFSGLTPPVCLPIFLYLSKRDRYNSPPPSHWKILRNTVFI